MVYRARFEVERFASTQSKDRFGGEREGAPGVTSHRFGGAWTELKLDAVRYYLEFYAGALRRQPFDLWYIDAFAGTGDREAEMEIGGFFDLSPARLERISLDGSARRAMEIKPGFKHLIFIEQDAKRYAALKELERQDERVECLRGDANSELPRLFSRVEWNRTGSERGQRGVVFLDPYGMQVSWDTLKALAHTKRVDVWYLFPLAAVCRQMAKDASAVDESKRRALNRIFGSEDWRTEFYRSEAGMPLFSDMIARDRRTASPEEIEAYFQNQLKQLFAWVSNPLPLFLDGGPQLFSLFLAISNDSPAAVQLARNGMRDLLRRYEPMAVRRNSGL